MELVCLNQRRRVCQHSTEVVCRDVLLLTHVCGRHATGQAPEDTHHRDTRATEHGLAVLNRWINHNAVMHHAVLSLGVLHTGFPSVALLV